MDLISDAPSPYFSNADADINAEGRIRALELMDEGSPQESTIHVDHDALSHADTDTDVDFDQDIIIAKETSDIEYDPKSTRSRKRVATNTKAISAPSKRSRKSRSLGNAKSKAATHKVKTQFACKSCEHAPFKDAATLQRHNAQTHIRAFICVFAFAGCSSTFASKDEWKRHVSSQHLKLSTWVCELPSCSKVLVTPNHGGQPVRGREFNRKDLFIQHLRRRHAPFALKRMQKNPEWEVKLKELAVSCLKVNRQAPSKLLCPLVGCSGVFEGPSCWDDRMEHVAKHLGKVASAGEGEVRQERDGLLVQWALREGIVEGQPGGNGYRLCVSGRYSRVDDEDVEDGDEAGVEVHGNDRSFKHASVAYVEPISVDRNDGFGKFSTSILHQNGNEPPVMTTLDTMAGNIKVDETVVEEWEITGDGPRPTVPLNDMPHSTLGNNSHKEPIVQDDQYTDSGYHTRLNTDTCSILSSDSIGPWPGLDPAISQDLITNFTKIILENPSISAWAGAAATTIPSDILEAKVALLLKEYSEELLPHTSSTPDAKTTRNACLFIRRNRQRIARCFRENANKAPTRNVFDQSKMSDELSLDGKMKNWDISSDHVHRSPDAVSEISDDGNEEFPIEFTKAREFLKSSPPFERLIDRLQVLYYDKGAKMLEIQTLVLSNMSVDAGSDGRTKACFQVSWDLAKFMATQYGHGSDVKLGSVITISGSALYCQALTAQDYLRQNWPTCGLQVLEMLQSALGNKKFSAQALNIDTGLALSVDLTTPSVVEIVGSLDKIVTVAQIITWFGAAFQSSDTSKEVQYSESIITPTTRNSFLINYVQTPLTEAERICWLPLFNNPVIAKGFPISTRGNREVGIEIPLEMMAFLSGAEHAVEYGRGLLIKSFSGMLVPVERQGNSVQWHFLSDPTGRRMRYSDLRGLCPRRLSLDELDHDSLGKTRAFLAWWRASESYLGTQNVSYENIGRSKARPTSMTVNVTDVTIGFSMGGGASTKFAMGLKDRHLYNSRAGRLERVLDAAQKMHTCIYDSTSKRSWLVSGTETLLHLVQTKHRRKPYYVNGSQITLDFANPACDGPGACRTALMDMASVPLYSNTAICSNDYCVKDLVYELWNSLEAIEKPDEDAGITFSLKFGESLKGYEMMDLVDDVGVKRQKEVIFKNTSGGWINMIGACYGIVLFGSHFGELIKPTSDTKGLCSSWVSLPEGKNYLAITTQKLAQIFGETDEEGHLTLFNSSGDLKLHKASLMFENCLDQLGKRCDCERTQQIVSTSRLSFKSINPPMYFGDTGCIILGRTRNVLRSPRSRSQTGLFSLPNHNILEERPRELLEDLIESDTEGSACFTENSNPREITSTSVCENRSHIKNGDELTPFPISDVRPFNPHAHHPQGKQCSMSSLDKRKSARIQRCGKLDEAVIFQLGQENLHSTPEISTYRRQIAGCDVGCADLRPAKLSDTGTLSSVDRSYQSSFISPASPGSTSSIAEESISNLIMVQRNSEMHSDYLQYRNLESYSSGSSTSNHNTRRSLHRKPRLPSTEEGSEKSAS